jgi:DNA-directed RNA polymerase III subunit RPC2
MEKNVFQRCVYIASDGGRVCRPLVIANKGISRIKEHHMKELMVNLISASCPK